MRWTPAAALPDRRVRRIGKTLLIGDCRARARRFKRFRTVSKKPSRPRYRRSAAARPVRFDPTRTARSTLDRDRFWRYRRAMGRRGDRIRFGRYRIAHRAAPRGSRRTQKRPTSGLSCGGRSTLPPSSSARRAGRRPPRRRRPRPAAFPRTPAADALRRLAVWGRGWVGDRGPITARAGRAGCFVPTKGPTCGAVARLASGSSREAHSCGRTVGYGCSSEVAYRLASSLASANSSSLNSTPSAASASSAPDSPRSAASANHAYASARSSGAPSPSR